MKMTIGQLSRRTGVNVKTLREYEGMGMIYTIGRSAGNYRLFDESALWCVDTIRNLRSLGLTVAEIREIAGIYLGKPEEAIAPHIASRVRAARSRIDARIQELQRLRRRIDEFEASPATHLGATGRSDRHASDPRRSKQPA